MGDGAVQYGVPAGSHVVIDPPRPAAERERDRAQATGGCPRCADLPGELITALTAALRAAKGGRP